MAMANPIDSLLKSLPVLSLEDISLRRVAGLLCSGPLGHVSATKVEARDEMFKGTVSKLEIPESLREPLSNIMNPVFMETDKWLSFHEEFLNPSFSNFDYKGYLKHMHRTHMGTINYCETAKSIILDENVDITGRFRLACLYCLGQDILDLWKKLSPQSKKEFFNNGRHHNCDPGREIIVIWIFILIGQEKELENFLGQCDERYSSIYQYAFETYAIAGYEAGTRYFFEKLTCEERNVSLVRKAEPLAEHMKFTLHPYSDVFCYFLSQMNAEQLQRVLEKSSYAIVKSFTEWPRQDAFPEVAKLASPYLGTNDYAQLHYFVSKNCESTYISPKLFRDLFLAFPQEFRISTYYLNEIFDRRDTEMVQLLFRDMDPAERLELVLNGMVLLHCYELVTDLEWGFFEFFIRTSKLSKKDREKFAVAFLSSSPLLKPEIKEHFTKLLNDIS